MTGITRSRCDGVVGRLARCRQTVVARIATTRQYSGVIKGSRLPGAGGVTRVASITRLHMGGRLAGGLMAVMTGHASAQNVGMVDANDRTPGDSAVTVRTSIRGSWVVGSFARRN